ncbi:MAG TPA: saccharopine dehydrogenase NADP-binding domain-containing protein [Thermoanaerobaculia bacterium]|nr:saccharopine dehydrogenase NADP-binding domain-containing protein [Thermoanaerobaculia bacterium]
MWLLYGANGYTGELIAREAARRGERPILAGRSADKIEPLAHELGCDWRAFDLQHIDLSGVQAVLHCAGPFIRTSKPMVDACLAAGVHYLDITGEIGVFEAIMARNHEAVARGVMLLPGSGFDVVPTDCLAAMLKDRMPDATELSLAFYSPRGEVSRGTLKTMIEGIGEGGAIRRDGKIVRVPLAYDVREIEFSCGKRTAMTIPWGDVSTAFHTTGIPNIRVYNAASPRAIRRVRWLQRLLPIVRLRAVRSILLKFAERTPGPDEEKRNKGRTYLWGRVSNGRDEITMTMTTPEGYQFTVRSALDALERVLRNPKPGSYTPSRALGKDFVNTISGVDVQ